MTKAKAGIYKIVNNINQKIYIGSSINLVNRKTLHFSSLIKQQHHSVALQRAFNKYGINNFVFEIIELVEDKDKLIEREQYYIDTLKPHYNICKQAGSSLGVKRSQETKEKLRKTKLGSIPWNKGTKGVMKAWNKGKQTGRKGIALSEEHKRKITESRKGIKNPRESYVKAINTKRKNGTLSKIPEQKLALSLKTKGRPGQKASLTKLENMRKAQLGKKHKEETKLKISNSNKGKLKTEEHRKKLSDVRKAYFAKLKELGAKQTRNRNKALLDAILNNKQA